jgi:hypothetical protein
VNLLTLINRVDNRLNPIVVKELRQAVKSRAVSTALLVMLAAQVIVATVICSQPWEKDGHLGRDLLQIFYEEYRASEFLSVCIYPLGLWALLITLLAIPWAMRQFQRFRPPPKPTRRHRPPVEEKVYIVTEAIS